MLIDNGDNNDNEITTIADGKANQTQFVFVFNSIVYQRL